MNASGRIYTKWGGMMLEFKTEAELCKAFVELLPAEWTAYNESCGYDILLVHESGFQIGVEAKLRLNAKVISQAIGYDALKSYKAPDFRAVLVSGKPNNDLERICRALHITVLRIEPNWLKEPRITPSLPQSNDSANSIWFDDGYWFDFCPVERLDIPEYVPDVEAGVPSPRILSPWKIQVLKMCYILESRGFVMRSDFKALDLSPTLFLDNIRFVKGKNRGEWTPTDRFDPNFYTTDHPEIYEQIKADVAKWGARIFVNQMGGGA